MKISVSANGGTPAEQVYGQLRGLIAAGRLAGGERLPSVRRLATDLGLAAGTVAKAYRQLEEDGLVTTRTGAGTRVSANASAVSPALARAARALAAAARREGLEREDAERILRAMWADPGEKS